MKKTCVLLAALILSTQSFASVSATAKAFPAMGFPKTFFTVIGEHHINITNSTKITQTYSYIYSLCPDARECVTETRQITLASGQTFTDGGKTTREVKYPVAGNYGLTAKTSIIGIENYEITNKNNIEIN